MAPPDVNSIPLRPSRGASTSNTNTNSQSASPELSRRTSSVMGPPPVPNNSSLPNSPRPPTATITDSSAVASGPIRHPRPLTAAELHLELEKEQESIVNRLTRELSALRAQTASVASTASSTSDLFSSQNLPEYPYLGSGASIIPTSTRRQRSSSNLSTRSARSARDYVANAARDAASTSVSGVAAPRDSHQASSRPSMEISRERPEISRQNSMTSGYRSTSATSPYTSSHPNSMGHAHRTSMGGGGGTSTSSGHNTETRSPSFSSAVAAARYEEAASQRHELEAVKKENEALRQRIRELEKALTQGQAQSSGAVLVPAVSISTSDGTGVS